MVGKRWASGENANGHAGNGHADGSGSMDHDREYGKVPKSRLKPNALRFKESAHRALEEQRRQEFKNKLLEEVDRHQFEEFRKSDEFIKNAKNKKLKKFYEEQNEALNDWLEVDTAVRFIADDIFESFDPDADHDGQNENGGPLQNLGEDVEAFLPEEEREKRRKEKKKAMWAINVRVDH